MHCVKQWVWLAYSLSSMPLTQLFLCHYPWPYPCPDTNHTSCQYSSHNVWSLIASAYLNWPTHCTGNDCWGIHAQWSLEGVPTHTETCVSMHANKHKKDYWHMIVSCRIHYCSNCNMTAQPTQHHCSENTKPCIDLVCHCKHGCMLDQWMYEILR